MCCAWGPDIHKIWISSELTVWTVEEAHLAFKVSRSTFDGWLSDRELPVTEIGARKFFLPSEVLRHLRENKLVSPKGVNRSTMGQVCASMVGQVEVPLEEWPLMKRSEFIQNSPFRPSFARRAIDKRQIPYIQIGKMVYVDLELLRKYLADFRTYRPPNLHEMGLL